MGILDVPFSLNAYRTVTVPTGLGWASSPLSDLTIKVPVWMPGPAIVNLSSSTVFGRFSAALAAPTNTYWVDNVGGNDTTGTGAQGAPWQTMDKARIAALAGGVPTKVMVKANGVANPYARNQMPCFQGSLTAAADIAWVAYNGRVVTGVFDQFAAPSVDGTYGNCYSWAVANVGRVFDTANIDRFGDYTELTQVSTAAICNVTPNSWAIVSNTTIYVHRADGVAVTNANTRVMRSAGNSPIQATVGINAYFGGLADGDGFDFEGSPGAVMNVQLSAPSSTQKAIVADNCSFKYAGSVGGSSQNFYADSLPGVVYTSRCRFDGAQTDGLNVRNNQNSGKLYVLSVNDSGYNNGRAGQGSCNGWTTHDDTRGINVGGDLWGNHGGSVASVNISKALLGGVRVRDDMGDLALSSANILPPTGIYVRDTAEYWLDGCVVDMAAPGRAVSVNAAGAKLHHRMCRFTSGEVVNPGGGTLDTY